MKKTALLLVALMTMVDLQSQVDISYKRKHHLNTVPTETRMTLAESPSQKVIITPVLKGDDFPDHYLSLTYDDGPDTYTNDLIDYLLSEQVLGTFFVCKDWSAHPVTAQSLQPLVGGFDNAYNSTGASSAGGAMLYYWDLGTGSRQQNNGSSFSPTINNANLVKFNTPTLQSYLDRGQLLGNHSYAHNDISVFTTAAQMTATLSPVQDVIDPLLTSKCYMVRAPYFNWPNDLTTMLTASSDPLLVKLGNAENYMDALIKTNDWISPLPCTPTCYWPSKYCWGGNLPSALASQMITDIGTNNDHGIILLHDRNEFVEGSKYALDITQSIVPTLKSNGFVFGAPVLEFSEYQIFSSGTDFSDSDGWGADIGYYGTLRLADVNGDGKDDMCARGANGIYVALANGTGGFSSASLWSSAFSDGANYKPAQYSTTLQFGDVNGDGRVDAIMRGQGANGIMVALNNSGTSFNTPTDWSATVSSIRNFSDNDGWNSAIYYGSIRVADVNSDGKADICARGLGGIYVALSSGSAFGAKTLWKSNDFRDADGYNDVKYSNTFQVGDVDGDNKPDVVIRGYSGMAVARNSGSSFGSTEWWSTGTDFSDADGWGSSSSYYGTIRLADINGDGFKDVCARSSQGIVVAFASPNLSGGHFLAMTTWKTGNSQNYSDTAGYNDPKYALTIQFGDINAVDYTAPSGPGDKRADLVARGYAGLTGGYAP